MDQIKFWEQKKAWMKQHWRQSKGPIKVSIFTWNRPIFLGKNRFQSAAIGLYQASLYVRFREALPRPFKLVEFANFSEVVNLWIASQIPVKLWISEWQMRRRWLNVVGLGLQKRFFLNFECLIIDILLNGILFIIRTNSCWKSCWDVGWRKAGALVRRYLVVAHTRTHVCRV